MTLFILLASLSSTSSADSVSDPGFSFGGKTKGGEIGLDGNGTPMTFSHHYSEKAPSVGKQLPRNALTELNHARRHFCNTFNEILNYSFHLSVSCLGFTNNMNN